MLSRTADPSTPGRSILSGQFTLNRADLTRLRRTTGFSDLLALFTERGATICPSAVFVTIEGEHAPTTVLTKTSRSKKRTRRKITITLTLDAPIRLPKVSTKPRDGRWDKVPKGDLLRKKEKGFCKDCRQYRTEGHHRDCPRRPDPHQQGQDAARRLIERTENPYPDFSEDRDLWFTGFDLATLAEAP